MVLPLTPDDPPALGGFRLAGRLGEGGQGVVYLAHSPSGEAVAVKVLTRVDPESRARLARELHALESVASFCTARVLAADVSGPRPYVVSEFVDGPSLERRVREHGPLRGGDLERLMVGTATALAAIHAAGVVHRDFKPANVLLGPDGPRVVDFGIARAEGAATLTSGLIGTPAYLSPEQIGGAPASPASDVFAWAATMLYAATGSAPFGGDTVPAVLNRVLTHHPDLSPLPPRLRGQIAACLDKDPARRPSARALMVALVDPEAGGTAPPVDEVAARGARIASGHAPPSAGGPGGDTDPIRPAAGTRPAADRRRHAGRMIAAVAVAALLVSAGTVAWLTLRPEGGTPVAGETSAATATAGPSGGPRETAPAERRSPAWSEEPSGRAEPEGSAVTIPAAFAGTWSGHIVPSVPGLLSEHDVRVELTAGESVGSWNEPTSGCEGTLRATAATGTTLTMELENAGECVPGTLTLTLKDDALGYLWRDGLNLGTTYTGDLRRD
ncbi:serine/threonine-protein kinase [Thermostaphylospora chromogena]|uniref:Serine/threonine protein kinase n=1 Tax=Thermostaphylospora chromogena TaxID=35622 RepID=A0A1H1GJD7_9ACTN|nr:serine/threonine-protein kinase [Thermostaphylospora chromogena]SDR13291.1 Serine/threonine protein kinase [Thermostaphylospora chromogena]